MRSEGAKRKEESKSSGEDEGWKSGFVCVEASGKYKREFARGPGTTRLLIEAKKKIIKK